MAICTNNDHLQEIVELVIRILGTLLDKQRTFFYGNLVNFNEVRLYEAILKLHTHAWIFPHLSIASVDGKKHLSEVKFSALIKSFIVRKITGSGSYPYTQDSQDIFVSTTSAPDFMNSIISVTLAYSIFTYYRLIIFISPILVNHIFKIQLPFLVNHRRPI